MKPRYGAFITYLSCYDVPRYYKYNNEDIREYLRVYRLASTLLVHRENNGLISILYKSTDRVKALRRDIVDSGHISIEAWPDSPNNTFIMMA